jgi:hypothetical protein
MTATILEVVMLVLLIEGFMKYVDHMASCGTIYTPGPMKISSATVKLVRGVLLRFYFLEIRKVC